MYVLGSDFHSILVHAAKKNVAAPPIAHTAPAPSLAGPTNMYGLFLTQYRADLVPDGTTGELHLRWYARFLSRFRHCSIPSRRTPEICGATGEYVDNCG